MSQIDAVAEPMDNQDARVQKAEYSNVIGWVLAVLLAYAAVASGGNVRMFLNLPSALLVLGLSYFLGVAAYGRRDFNYSLKALLFAYRRKLPHSLGIRHVGIIRSMRQYLIMSGVLGFLVGVVQMLNHMDDPSAIGPAVAVALLTVVYGVLLVLFICQPAISFLEDHFLRLQAEGKDLSDASDRPS